MSVSFWEASPSDNIKFERERHVYYMEMMHHLLPSHYSGQEINRLTLAYFVISGLDLLNALDRIDKEGVISWVLSLQAHPRSEADLESGQFFGFHGSRSSQFEMNDNGALIPNGSHLASTYCALAVLRTVGYNLSSMDSRSILKSIKYLQQPNGSFMPTHIGAETDLRFVYCAAAICFMLENWSGMDREKAKEYILSCQSYDGGFGLVPSSESHGGATYCALASLLLMGFIEDDLISKSASSSCIIDVPLLLDWSLQVLGYIPGLVLHSTFFALVFHSPLTAQLQRQARDGGFQGRANKDSDTCYAFWVGGVLKILGAHKFIDQKASRDFLSTCQSEYGGFSKFPGQLPDLYHSYYGITAFSLLNEPGLNPISVALGIAGAAGVTL